MGQNLSKKHVLSFKMKERIVTFCAPIKTERLFSLVLFLVDVAMLWSFTVVNSLPVEAWALNSLVLLLIFWLLKDFQARISKL